MVDNILTAAGVVHRRARFPHPPKGTYAVWFDDLTTDGPDGLPSRVIQHDCTVEVYEPAPDDDAEAAIEAALNASGLQWAKQARYWLQSEQLYQAIYECTYIEKRRL